MKYLIPIDFSDYAEYAIQMGVSLAKKTNADIHIIHSIDEIKNLAKWDLKGFKSGDLVSHIKSLLLDKLILAQRIVMKQGIYCTIELTEGSLIDNLTTLLNKDKFECVIMGSHGVTGNEEWLIGSNTSKALRKLHHNILVVKNPVEEIDFSDVAFISGLNLKELESFRKFLYFINPLEVNTLHVITVDTNNYFSQPSIVMTEALNSFKKVASGYSIQTHFYPDYSIEAGVRHFAQEYHIDLIGISYHVRSPLKRMLLGSNVEMIVNQCRVPVLSIDY